MCDPGLDTGCGWGRRTRVRRPGTITGDTLVSVVIPKIESEKMTRVNIVDLVDLKSLLVPSND